MNMLDIIICIILIIAAVRGYRHGAIRQVCGIAGVILGVWLGYRFSTLLAGWFGMNAKYASLLCFILILIAAIVALYIVGVLFGKIFRMTGFGLVDNIVGLMLGVVKIGLVLSLLLGVYVKFNAYAKISDPGLFSRSTMYGPMRKAAEVVFPWVENIFDNGKLKVENWTKP